MQTITYTKARNNLAKEMERVSSDHDYTVITRANQESAVLMSLEDFSSWQETAYLLSSPSNAKRLMRSLEQLDSGGGQVRELIEDD
ncbi:type II toxin-antitoxin system prevent-host-death family antitoxin [Lentisphaera profundi]|uniref:Antitoxin n=1 Tax=Lentisphaera profundi TaxID=1658616 RepID=A0ABY7VQB6_9BACT|nr:type II toxin-antitoxin system prevent-host-death family antitoxin [Lentisphaera profundi]WDE96375.1 type II toxin-antitoxin system prevent-host-death family antitoxin [Lentisphaera profundi]